MLLASADGNPDAQRLWIQNGGDTTLLSYRIDPLEFMAMAPEKRAQLLVRSVGADMIMWLAALPVHYRSGDYFFCHAGIRPGVALAKQRREDLLWIRGDFVSSRRRHGAVIVHGHSETTEVEVTKSRINVDTAAYRSGALTAVGLQENLRWFLSTSEKYLNQAELEIALRNRRC
jgi:serine/threonine protein phosphatase 1